MPIPIDRRRAQELRPRLDEALELVRNEFSGLDAYHQYRNSFSRLLKPDPLGRVMMLGTDQRDLFVPELRRAIETYVPGDGSGHIFDFGAGDGQTFALAADAVPAGTRVSVEEPNPGYAADYAAFLERMPGLTPGIVLVSGIDDLDGAAAREAVELPADGSIHLALALHMLYFASDLTETVSRMVRFLAPGGAMFIVFADEDTSYAGHVVRAFIADGGDTGDNAGYLRAGPERAGTLLPAPHGEERIAEALAGEGIRVRIDATLQPSRLYGHSLTDLLALSAITNLSDVPGVEKFTAALELLASAPETVELRIEDSGPRMGMWSVAQPQWVVTIRRLASA